MQDDNLLFRFILQLRWSVNKLVSYRHSSYVHRHVVTEAYVYYRFIFTAEFHYNLFPKPIGQVVQTYGVQEFHLSLTRGRWKTRLWGYPPLFTPPGTEAWAWFLPGFG